MFFDGNGLINACGGRIFADLGFPGWHAQLLCWSTEQGTIINR